jgi:RNA-dependent RNA polymerase
MQIFMRNIAFGVTEGDLQLQLAAILHKPPFPIDPPVNFNVKLIWRQGRRGHKGSGILTLPSETIGEKFLSIYGRDTFGMSVQGRQISFRRCHTERQDYIERVRSTPWEDPQVLKNQKRRIAAALEAIPVQLWFGLLCRDRSFSAEMESLGSVKVVCDISARQVQFHIEEERLLDLRDLRTSKSITTARFLSSRIIAISATPQAGGKHHVFLESLSPPLFEATTPDSSEPITQRVPFLTNKTMPPVSRCVCITFNNRIDVETFLERCRMLHLPRPVELDTPIERRNIYSEDNLKQLADFLGTLSLDLAYEIEKAIAAAILDPLEFLTSLKDPVSQLQHDSEHAAPIFRRFVSNLDAPTFAGSRRRGNVSSGGLRSPELQGLPELLRQSAAAHHYAELSRPRGLFPPSPAIFQAYQLIVTPSTRILEGPLPDRGNG